MNDLIIGEAPAWLSTSAEVGAFVASLCSPDAAERLAAANRLQDGGWEIRFSESDATEMTISCRPDQAWETFKGLRSEHPTLDVMIQPESMRNYRLLLCDMDMTMVDSETLDDVAAMAGMGEQIAEITRRAMLGEIEFDQALRERIRMLQGLPVALFEQMGREVVLNPGAEDLISACRVHGIHTILISGGFIEVVEQVASRLGFDEFYCNRLHLEDEFIARTACRVSAADQTPPIQLDEGIRRPSSSTR